jgi:hypothetical protein
MVHPRPMSLDTPSPLEKSPQSGGLFSVYCQVSLERVFKRHGLVPARCLVRPLGRNLSLPEKVSRSGYGRRRRGSLRTLGRPQNRRLAPIPTWKDVHGFGPLSLTSASRVKWPNPTFLFDTGGWVTRPDIKTSRAKSSPWSLTSHISLKEDRPKL